MTWVVRLAKIGADGEEHWVDVAQIARPGDLGDIANLGLTMTEGKLVLAGPTLNSNKTVHKGIV